MTIALSLSANTPPSKEVARVADRILNSKRVVFVAGAGISCSAGIPDFRSLHGLYSSQESKTVRGQDLFDVSLFKCPDTTALYYKFMARLRQSALKAQPTPTHRLIKTFKDHGNLLRFYSQNIDGLEARAGLNLHPLPLKSNDVVQLHGDLHSLKCSLCSTVFACEDRYMLRLQEGSAVECPQCADKCAMRVALGRRSVAIGCLRPDVILYGEPHPASERIAKTCNMDMKKKPDCLIIAGTSLKVPGLKRLVKGFATTVHEHGGIVVFINLTEVAAKEWSNVIDFHVRGTSDHFVELLHKTRPSFFTKQVTLSACRKQRMGTCKKPHASAEKQVLAEVPRAKLQTPSQSSIAGKSDVLSGDHNKENEMPLKRAPDTTEEDMMEEARKRVCSTPHALVMVQT